MSSVPFPMQALSPDEADGGPWHNIFANVAAQDIPDRFVVHNANSDRNHVGGFGDDIIVTTGNDANSPPAADSFDGERCRSGDEIPLESESIVWVRCSMPRYAKVQVVAVA